jgi:hypothetical protein
MRPESNRKYRKWAQQAQGVLVRKGLAQCQISKGMSAVYLQAGDYNLGVAPTW